MERALSPELLAAALGGQENLPSPDELRRLIAAAEVDAFFAGEEAIPPELRETAWFLHQVGTVRPSLGIYTSERQVQANAVAAHIFDLILGRSEMSLGERLVLTFAAQVSSIRGDRMPNAVAVGSRIPTPDAVLPDEPGRASLEAGCAFLTLDRRRTRQTLARFRAQIRQSRVASGGQLLVGREFGCVGDVIEGTWLLQRYLDTGNEGDREEARRLFEVGVNSPYSERDLDSRWVAAHLLDLCDDLGTASVWANLPVGTPPAVGRAMAFGDPPVLSLWPPQVALLTGSLSPLSATATRIVLTFPTSAGKTLLTQLIVAHHLATVGSSVCVVAPTHSLCREIREGLRRRLWVLRRDLADGGTLGDLDRPVADVVVMTPEKLAARLRLDEEQLLAEFGLFVLDEAHLIADAQRGWAFETTISRLHEMTAKTGHRIVVASAALGGAATVRAWLDGGETHADEIATWRGPRRLYATYGFAEDSVRKVPAEGRQRLPRYIRKLSGVVRLYVGDSNALARRRTSLGETIQAGTKTTTPSRAERLRPLVLLASRSGPVLTVHSTKRDAENLAKAVAAELDYSPLTEALVRLAEQRLDPAHPLVALLRKGVAYHHAALPVDVQVEIEDAVRDRRIGVICATTTLTEGVNLPVRTVIVAERGYYDGQWHEIVDGAMLLNAAGRAGRAGRETEGWVIVADQGGAPSSRGVLRSIDADLNIRSSLTSAEALRALSQYEQLVGLTDQALLTSVPPEVDDFLSYCWFLADTASIATPTERFDKVIDGLRHTLAWKQLAPAVRGRWEDLARKVVRLYESTDVTLRQRWARTGFRLQTNEVVERVVADVSERVAQAAPSSLADPIAALELLLLGSSLDDLLGLVDERNRRFKKRRFGKTHLLAVDLRRLILDWAKGDPLAVIATSHLSEVEGDDAEGYRFEQLSSFLAQICEHHLPWTIGVVIDWVQQSTEYQLCPELPAHLRYGVPDPVALALMKAGVRSRRLAVAVGAEAIVEGVAVDSLRRWLSNMGVPAWRTRLEASPAEVGDLLRFVHDRSAGVSASLLEGTEQEVACDLLISPGHPSLAQPLRIDFVDNDEVPFGVGAFGSTGELIARIRPADHHNLAVLIDGGFELVAEARLGTEPSSTTLLALRLAD